jgi:pilus assembly protein CpaE
MAPDDFYKDFNDDEAHMSDIQPILADNTKVSVVLIAPDNERRRSISKIISGTQARIIRDLHEYPDAEGLARLVKTDCDVILVDLDGGVEAGVELIGAICVRNVLVTVMACSTVNEADVVIRSMRAGAREFLTDPLSVRTIAEALTRACARRQNVTMDRGAGKVLVFQGSKGGVGLTTIAINFAVALVKEDVGKILLVDMHPQLGEVALGLGMSPRFSIADALENSSRLDADFLSTLVAKHESGLMVMASSDGYGTHRSLERGTEKLLRIMREEFAFVVVDAGGCSGNTPDTLFEIADAIYLVTEVNLPALRNARRLISCFAAKESVRGLEVVLNRYNSRKVEIDEESTTKALSRPVDWKIPNDYMSVRSAQNLGNPLVMQDTPISRAICQMAKAAVTRIGPSREHEALPASKGDKWKFWTSKNIRPLSIARS